ncbi:MAG: prolipoprotein diacylglyceryl transferase [Geodermatophilaceae bacterium]|nr:prolipoprotein diacylglyceryl transferase [Geodermatophilaceae bacterium]
MILAALPSPTQGVWELGPVPIRAYALFIIVGIFVAVWMAERRYVARGGRAGDITDIAVTAVPFGIVGGRLYHVVTTPDPYFGAEGSLVDAFKIWQGGLGIWGAVALGGVGAFIAARRRGLRLAPMADAMAPGIVVAQAIGRLGNWFNNELYGRPTDLPWGLEIYEQVPGGGRAAVGPDGLPVLLGTFQPTFLYELIWNLGVAALVIWADRRFTLGRGRAFALYVAVYCAGRVWIEALRIDTAERILGLRLNVWTSVIVFLLAVGWMLTHRGPRESDLWLPGRNPGGTAEAEERSRVDLIKKGATSSVEAPAADGGATTDPPPKAADPPGDR